MTQSEKSYLQDLAHKYKEACMTAENDAKRKRWYDINDLVTGSKPVFINHYWPLAMSEIFPNDTYYCTDPMAREFEIYFKTRLFYNQDLKDDNVLEPVIYAPMKYNLQSYAGIDAQIYRSEHDGGSGAYEIIPVLLKEEDSEKVNQPLLHYDEEASRANFELTQEIFEPILTVIKDPTTFAAKISDEYSWLRGLEETYLDLYDDPDWTHKVLGQIKDNFFKRFKLMEEAGLWGTLDLSFPLGSAGLRYATGMYDFRDYQGKDLFAHKVPLDNSWGFSCSEVFNCVSGDMHKEFSFDYDIPAMDVFKYSNVGCCEVLDKKVDLIREFHNARKISVSEWCDYETAAKAIKNDYVYSYRAAGTHFLGKQMDRENAEKEIRGVLEASKLHGCSTEIVLNIGGTLGVNPRDKVIEWSKMTREFINAY